MAWRLARSLQVLRDEVRALHPGTTVWDIGDPVHAATASDHNPNKCCEVVCAVDVLGNAGLNLNRFAHAVIESGHPALKYVIFNRMIWSKNSAAEGWRPYRGSNPHTTHVHVSVGVGPDGNSTGPYDNQSPWGVLTEEGTMELNDRVNLWDERGNKPWRAGRSIGVTRAKPDVSVGQLLQWGGETGHLMHNRVLPMLTAILAAIEGEDSVAAVRAAIREEIASIVPELAAELGELVPEQQVEQAMRRVLGSLDEE